MAEVKQDVYKRQIYEESLSSSQKNDISAFAAVIKLSLIHISGSKMQIAQRIKKIDSLDNLFNDCDEEFDSYNVCLLYTSR